MGRSCGYDNSLLHWLPRTGGGGYSFFYLNSRERFGFATRGKARLPGVVRRRDLGLWRGIFNEHVREQQKAVKPRSEREYQPRTPRREFVSREFVGESTTPKEGASLG